MTYGYRRVIYNTYQLPPQGHCPMGLFRAQTRQILNTMRMLLQIMSPFHSKSPRGARIQAFSPIIDTEIF
jgi:hypothetical protein